MNLATYYFPMTLAGHVGTAKLPNDLQLIHLITIIRCCSGHDRLYV